MITLALTPDWDISLNEVGGLATADGPAAVAQGVANACRLFTNDAYFNQDQGIPYFENILGYRPNAAVIAEQLSRAARTVANVETATVIDVGMVDRGLTGNIDIVTTGGETIRVNF